MEGEFAIDGLSGARVLQGELPVKGAKNAALKALVASVLFEDTLRLENVPDIADITRMVELLEYVGADVTQESSSTKTVEILRGSQLHLNEEIASRFRGSIVLSGPILARFGRISLPHPGGCVIGKRPIDIFLEGFEKMGARVNETQKGYELETPSDGLSGADIFLRVPSVTATETFLMAAVLVRGTTRISNAALEPEITHLARFLKTCGARISGIGTPNLIIEGGDLLRAEGKSYLTPPDRIEAGSFAILGALAGQDIRVAPIIPEELRALWAAFDAMGISYELGEDEVRIAGNEQTAYLPTEVKTHEYPGFPTDLQGPMTVLLTQAHGESLVFETIFEGRLHYTEELRWMGADILSLDPHRVLVRGPSELRGRELKSPDLRAGISFILAAACARGRSVIHNTYNIDRGYENLEERLRAVGLEITREGSSE